MSRAKLAADVGNTNILHPHLYIPDDVIDRILARLPITDAVRTSVLSRNWRFQWQKMSNLVFDTRCIPSFGNHQGPLRELKLVRIIDSVLSLHVGPIRRFMLLTRLRSFPDIDRWIAILRRNHIKEIVLSFSDGEPYIVPSHLFCCDQLFNLGLHHCELKPSLSFSELPNLGTLVLRNIQDPDGRVEELISSCPSLKVLRLDNIEGPKHLKLCAPRLYKLYIHDIYFDITIGNAPDVGKLDFRFHKSYGSRQLNQEWKIKIAKIVSSLSKLEKLLLDTCSLQCFYSGGHNLDRLPATYEYMEELFLSIDFHVKEEFLASLCLLRSFPNLKVLYIVFATTEGSHNTSVGNSSPVNLEVTFHQLLRVRVVQISGTQQELLLLKFILASAPALQSLVISTHPGKRLDDSKIFIELLRYPRASSVCEVIYKEVGALVQSFNSCGYLV